MHVSYRDSKLTRLLQPSLSGNAKMSVVCCITAAEKYLEETRSTLQFAQRASMVKTSAKVNEVLDDSAKIRRLEREIRLLKEGGNASSPSAKAAMFAASAGGPGSGAAAGVGEDAEKMELLKRLDELQHEREKATAKIHCLKELVVSGGSDSVLTMTMDSDASFDMGALRKPIGGGTKSRKRDTWCPGFTAAPAPLLDGGLDTSLAGDLSADSANSASTVVLEAQVTHQKEKMDDLRSALAAAEAKIAEVAAEKAAEGEVLVTRLEAVEEAAGFKDQELATLNAEVMRINSVLGVAEAEKEDLQQQLEDLSVASKRQKLAADEAHESLARTTLAETAVAAAEQEMKDACEVSGHQMWVLSQQLAQAHKVAETAVADAITLRSSQAADAMAAGAVEESEAAAERAQQQVYTLAQQLREAEDMAASHQAALRAANAANAVTLCSAEQEAERQEVAALASFALAQRVRALETDLALKATTVAALEAARHGEADQMAEQLVELTNRVDALSTEKLALEEENSQMDEMVTSLEEGHAEASARADELHASLQEHKVQLKQAASMQQQLEEDLTDATEAATAAETAAEATAAAVAETAKATAGDEDAMSAMVAEMEALRSELAASQAQNVELKARVEAAEAGAGVTAELADRLEVAEASLLDREEALEEAQVLLTETEAALIDAQEHNSSAASSNTEEMLELVTQVAALHKAVETANTKAEDATELAKESEERITSLRGECVSLQTQCAAADKTAGELNTILSTNREQRLALEEQVEQLQKRLEEAEDQLAELPTMPLEGVDQILKGAMQPDAALIEEMNVLMEQKIEAEARVEAAEANARSYREQLSEHDKASAREQEEFCEAAEQEMTALRSALDEKDKALQEKEDAIAAVENELFTLQQSVPGLIAADITSGVQAGTAAAVGGPAFDASTVELRGLIAEKDKRIAHLETTKLTKEQMQKIKQVKEERSKYYAECKTLKKNLKDLKKAYDEIAASPAALLNSAPNNFGAEAVAQANQATTKLAETKALLQTTKDALQMREAVVASLKDKLKECGKQLQEYEVERRAVVDVLGHAGVDTTGLLLCDASLDESLGSMPEGSAVDLCEAVKLLADMSHQAAAATSEQASSLSAASGKAAQTEAARAQLSNDLAQAGGKGVRLERENMKLSDALEATQTELGAALSERDDVAGRVAALQKALDKAERSIDSANDAGAQSELLALEEENLELMKENKDLRIQVSCFKSGKVVPPHAPPMAQENAVNGAVTAKVVAAPSSIDTATPIGADGEEQPGECNQS